MSSWPLSPIIYEVNTWAWLHQLSRRYKRPISLRDIPAGEWDALSDAGFDALWLMGVWERSPAGARIARELSGLGDDYRKALPDFCPEDVVGSPYCVRRYVVDEHLGGPEGLAAAREMLAKRGVKLILDFVPNHTAIDHPWVSEHPEYFIRGTGKDLKGSPEAFFKSGRVVFACGRDPFFPPWRDTAQLNAFAQGLRRAHLDTLLRIAGQCDGVRCDMAMLLVGDVFEKTWGRRAGKRPRADYWMEVIPAVRKAFPDFLFIAEVYWDLEAELIRQGFDYCYDKKLYDLLVEGNTGGIRDHLGADPHEQQRLLRFLENHDEPRASAAFARRKLLAAAVAFATLPGAKLFHQGQLEGRRIKAPVQLGRWAAEAVDGEMLSFYGKLIKTIRAPAFLEGDWRLCERDGWPDNPSFENLLAWCLRKDEERYLVVINYSETRSQGRVLLPWRDLDGRNWSMQDLFSGSMYERCGGEMIDPGLFVDLGPWGFHFLRF